MLLDLATFFYFYFEHYFSYMLKMPFYIFREFTHNVVNKKALLEIMSLGDNTTLTEDQPSSNLEGHETPIIFLLSVLAFMLSPLTVASNILVIIPFCRLTRVRTASNFILLALAITDGLLGFLLFLSSFSGKSFASTFYIEMTRQIGNG